MVVCAIALVAARGSGWKSMEKRLPVALRALARFKSAKKGRYDAKDAADEI